MIDFINQPSDRPGRPRSARADQAIIQAALELLIEQGYDQMSMEAIAARASVGKTTVYRRYASKDEVVAAVLATVHQPVEIPDTGNTLNDLLLLGAAFRESTVTSVVFPVVRQLLSLASSNPELFNIFNRQIIEPRQEILKTILRRGIERGEIRTDINLDLLVSNLLGAIIYQVLFRLEPGERPSQEFIERTIRLVIEGIQTQLNE